MLNSEHDWGRGRGRKSISVNLVTYPYVSPTIEENDDCLDLKVLIILYEIVCSVF